MYRPTKEQVAAAYNKTLTDLIGPNLKVLFCGINPGLYSGAVGHHFARPGNRFWPALYAGGFSDRLLSPFEEAELLERGYGLTNIVDRATASADELSPEEFVEGGRKLARKVRRYKPRFVAFLGLSAYRTAFARKNAGLGLQPDRLGDSALWVLPSPSGLNAHYKPADLARMFTELRLAVEASD